ncbi:NAD(P)-binding Rossmann-fold superfamily protein [Prunus dulcis]|uniref:NAD(P)-binding Rossmann-fold superfamily protein n=1 Tax=Prunus dulcis TaxID=3755 RepID=A0A4Y1RGI7_PRUDU|nr:NAD(P)-binding Rossmann-fold superfamily protein [Prunus dulcis]
MTTTPIHQQDLPLNILINNAGIMATPFKLSQDNIELHFATNHLVFLRVTFVELLTFTRTIQCAGHFLLADLLLETMKSTLRERKTEGRIVNVSSLGHRYGYREGFCFDKINDESRYHRYYAYAQSKISNILHANELTRRLKGAATTCFVALHPQLKGVGGEYFVDCNIA